MGKNIAIMTLQMARLTVIHVNGENNMTRSNSGEVNYVNV